jgi:hypothetical protein
MKAFHCYDPSLKAQAAHTRQHKNMTGVCEFFKACSLSLSRRGLRWSVKFLVRSFHRRAPECRGQNSIFNTILQLVLQPKI